MRKYQIPGSSILLHLLIATALDVVRIAAGLAETTLARTRTSPFVALGKEALTIEGSPATS